MAPRFWWIDEPMLAGGPNPTDDELAALRSGGFATIVCLLDTAEAPNYDVERVKAAGFSRHDIPIRDYDAPTPDQVVTFLRIIERAGPDDGKIIVHCQGGTGRTGTMAAAYWIARGFTVEAAIEKVRSFRPGAIETEGQEQRLRECERRLRARSSRSPSDTST